MDVDNLHCFIADSDCTGVVVLVNLDIYHYCHNFGLFASLFYCHFLM